MASRFFLSRKPPEALVLNPVTMESQSQYIPEVGILNWIFLSWTKWINPVCEPTLDPSDYVTFLPLVPQNHLSLAYTGLDAVLTPPATHFSNLPLPCYWCILGDSKKV